MIKIETLCEDCIHYDVCINKGKAENSSTKLKNALYDKHPDMDYNWDIMSTNMHFDVVFKCIDFKPIEQPQFEW